MSGATITAPATTTEKQVVKLDKTKPHQIYKTSWGLRVSGVTTILNNLGWNKNVLMYWAVKETKAGRDPFAVRDKAADVGSIAHFLVECHINGWEPDLGDFAPNDIDKAENGFLGFLDWEKRFKPEYIHSEVQIVSDQLLYGGTIDVIARIDGKLCLLDLKTSKGVYIDHKIQVAAYRRLYEGFFQEKLNEVHILQLDKETGAFNHHPLANTEMDSCFYIFLLALHLHPMKEFTRNKKNLNPRAFREMREWATYVHAVKAGKPDSAKKRPGLPHESNLAEGLKPLTTNLKE